MRAFRYEFALGEMLLAEDAGSLIRVDLPGTPEALPENCRREESPLLAAARDQLEEYFRGDRREFSLPLAPVGTPFQLSCWGALIAIPYGETRSYGQIAMAVGRPAACRAVGGANHRNPIAIIIPCHRVIGADGSLTGYGGGLSVKARLLELERTGILPPA